ncbi:hypothetical protein ACFW2D_08980 [Streptomyces sp. NPDC058914]|uniref:hypothetical protein n=1 Tax=Streptomyces TaxID=1883 RepID=UPI0036C4E2B7
MAWAGALAASVALVLWGASIASAGGPTSALVVAPALGETAGLYNGDREYGELERLLGPVDGAGDTRAEPADTVLDASHRVNVTWLVHDVSPWRIDQVYLASDGGTVWIRTSGDPSEAVHGRWHRAEQPAQLRALLRQLGVTDETPREGSSGSGPAPARTDGAEPAATDTAGPVASEADARAAEAGGGTDGWWALPGAAAGAVLALLLRPFAVRAPLRRAAARRESGPPREEGRQKLIDL